MTAPTAALLSARRVARFGLSPAARRIWMLTAVLAAAATGLFGLVATQITVHGSPIAVPWWLLAIAFYVAETNVVHLEFRGQAHTFSLSENVWAVRRNSRCTTFVSAR